MLNKNLKIKVLLLLSIFLGVANPETSFASSSKLPSAQCKIDDMNCYESYMKSLITKFKGEEVLQKFNEIAGSTNGLNGQCNNYGRFIGEEFFKKYGVKALNFHSDTCGRSFAYGLMAALGKKIGKAALNPSIDYCKTDTNLNACVYGVGNAMAQAKVKAPEINSICVKTYPYDNNFSYEDSAQGICVLGWVSAMSDLSTTGQFATLKSAVTICKGMKDKAYDACVGESSFTYTYKDNPPTEKRLARVFELSKNCVGSSEICARFVGKALNDYLLYSWRPDLTVKKNVSDLSNLIGKLCTGKTAKSCLQGFIYANSVHTTKESSMTICAYLKNDLAVECKKLVG
jgi:hypothetical protein